MRIGLIAIVGLAGAAQGQIVTNGTFETGELAPWVWTADANAEPFMVAAVDTFQGSLRFRVNPGNNVGGGGGSAGGNLEQQVTLAAGTEYTISGDLHIENLRSGTNSNGGTISVVVDGEEVHSWTIGSIDPFAIQSSSFSVPFTPTTSGAQSLTLRFTRTFRNSVPSIYHWADNIAITGGSGGGGCYANCDGSTGSPLLTANDFQCFLNKYAANDPYANCDGSTGSPLLTANDFQCFLNKYAAGCT